MNINLTEEADLVDEPERGDDGFWQLPTKALDLMDEDPALILTIKNFTSDTTYANTNMMVLKERKKA